ncbi:MAG: hypothetical protein MUF30_08630, partial [Burkholderiales bacterium]|nr:hypothetical protein [Burkholderiales bacterium]
AALSRVDLSLEDACAAWMALQSERLTGVVAISVWTGASANGRPPSRVVSRPRDPDRDVEADADAALAAEALERRAPFVRSTPGGFHVVVPLEAPAGWAIVARTQPASAAALQALIDALRWGSGWLSSIVRQAAMRESRAQSVRAAAIDAIVDAVRGAGDAPAATAMVAQQIAARWPGADAVVALWRRDTWVAQATTPPAAPEACGTDRTAWLDAVREARVAIVSPRQRDAVPSVLDRVAPDVVVPDPDAVIAVPMADDSEFVGAICVARPDPVFDADAVALLDELAPRIAPLLRAKPQAATPVEISWRRRVLVALFGPVRLRAKLAFVAVLVATLILLGATDDYAISGRGVVDGVAPRTLAAAAAGTVTEVQVRRGDAVRRNQVLGRFEESDIVAERIRLLAEREALVATTAARVPSDAAAPEVPTPTAPASTAGRLREIDAALRAVDERAARSRITSPVDGVVIGGAALAGAGAGVGARDALFVIAPEGDWRLRLEVDPRDAGLLLEARLDGLSGSVQPGASGQVEVDVGARKRAWIWWRAVERAVGSRLAADGDASTRTAAPAAAAGPTRR